MSDESKLAALFLVCVAFLILAVITGVAALAIAELFQPSQQ